MSSHNPDVRPISDLIRDARGLVARARDRQEPVVITQRGRDVAVLVPIEMYRRMERQAAHRIPSPRLVRSEDAARFAMTLTILETAPESPSAGV